MKPWHNCPPCPKGCGPTGTPVASAGNGFSGPVDSNLTCSMCGIGWAGTAAEVEQATKADLAWDRKCAQDEREKKRRAKAERLARLVAEARRGGR